MSTRFQMTRASFALLAAITFQSTLASPTITPLESNHSVASTAPRSQHQRPTPYEKLLDIANKAEVANPFLIAALSSTRNDDVIHALYVAGRIADPSLAELVAPHLKNRKAEVRAAAAFALGQIGGEIALNSLLLAMQLENRESVRGVLFVSLGKVASKPQLSLFLGGLDLKRQKAVVEGAAEGLALLWTREREGWTVPETAWSSLLTLIQSRSDIADKAAVALVRYRGEKKASFVAPLAKAIPNIRSSSAKASAFRALGLLKFPEARQALLLEAVKKHRDVEVRVELVNALAKQEFSPEIALALSAFFQDQNSQVVVAALQGVAVFKTQVTPGSDILPFVLNFAQSHESLWVQKNALSTLVALNAEIARPLIEEILKDASSPLYTSAISGLGLIAKPEDGTFLLTLLESEKTDVVIAALESLASLETTMASSLNLQNAVTAGLVLKDSRAICSAADIATKWQLKGSLPQFVEAFENATQEDRADLRICVLNLLGELGSEADVPFLEKTIGDNIVQVSQAAFDAAKKITQTTPSTSVTVHSRLSHPTPSLKEVRGALKSALVVTTSRGKFRIKMLSDAPLTATNIVQLAKQGFYNNLSFHRVVPHFVVQGGDPRGDGWGGPGYFIRNEPSLLAHDVGTVGIATSGKDTGGSQFFVNTATNLHLNGQYTLFAKVTDGMDVVNRLEEGDRILKVEVK